MKLALTLALSLASSLSLAGFSPLDIKDLRVGYENESGNIKASKFVYSLPGKKLNYSPLDAKVLKVNDNIAIKVEKEIVEVPQLNTILSFSGRVDLTGGNILAKNNFIRANVLKQVSVDDGKKIEINKLKFDCDGVSSNHEEEYVKYYETCIESGKSVLTIDTINLVPRQNVDRVTKGKAVVENNKFVVTAKAKRGIFNIGISSTGLMVYKHLERLMTIKLETAKVGAFDVREKIFEEIEKKKEPRITVKRPYIYIDTTKQFSQSLTDVFNLLILNSL